MIFQSSLNHLHSTIENKLSAMPWWHCAAFLILFVSFIALVASCSEKIICLSKLDMQGVHHW